VATRALGTMLYGVQATDPLTYASMAALVTAMAVFACLIPALRAARVDPLTSLRQE
jgi:putative ABC transport system permease protein